MNGIFKKLHQQKLLVPTLFFIPTLCCLLLLGGWQLERKQWKEDLLSEIATRTISEPQDLDAFLKKQNPTEGNNTHSSLEYFPVRVRGSFLHDRELYFYAPDPQLGAGYHVYTPFKVKKSASILLVNRGYVPENKKEPQSRKEGQSSGEVEITGLLRSPGTQGMFVPDNNPPQNIWFWRDLEGMMRVSFKDPLPQTYPFFLETREEARGGWPKGQATRLEFPNRHLEYALTWFGLACALTFIFGVYVFSRRHETTKKVP